MMLCQVGSIEDIKKYHLKGYIAQEKKDGCRCLAICSGEFVTLKGRTGTDYTSKFPEVVEELKGFVGVLDGEIMCDTFEHTSSRVHTENKLKGRLLAEQYPSKLSVFDLIEVNNQDIRHLPQLERLKLLWKCLQDKRYVVKLPFSYDLVDMWEKAVKNAWEGIIIKNLNGKYEEKRSWNWIKIKKEVTRDILVDKYTLNSAGIRAEGEGLAVQITGSNSQIVKNKIDTTGSCKIEVKGLEITENNKIRQIVFKDIKDSDSCKGVN